MAESDEQISTVTKSDGKLRFAVLVIVVAAIAFSYWQLGETLSLAHLARRESQLRAFQDHSPMLVYGVAFLAYVVVTGLSLPGATVLTLLYAWFFGLVRGVILVSFASTAGATLAFLLSRFLFRNAIQRRFGDRLEKFNLALAREGPYFLFTLRMIPAIPFFVINAVMGLTPMAVGTFWWVSQLGMLPGTAVFIYAGSSVPGLQTLADKGIGAVFTPGQLGQLLLAFAALGVFPLIVRRSPSWGRPRDKVSPTSSLSRDHHETA